VRFDGDDCIVERFVQYAGSLLQRKQKFTVAEAFETRRTSSEGEESRNRKVKAEAEAAEDGRRAKGSPNRAFQPGRPKSPLFFSCF
jgi:hypothetical protein